MQREIRTQLCWLCAVRAINKLLLKGGGMESENMKSQASGTEKRQRKVMVVLFVIFINLKVGMGMHCGLETFWYQSRNHFSINCHLDIQHRGPDEDERPALQHGAEVGVLRGQRDGQACRHDGRPCGYREVQSWGSWDWEGCVRLNLYSVLVRYKLFYHSEFHQILITTRLWSSKYQGFLYIVFTVITCLSLNDRRSSCS